MFFLCSALERKQIPGGLFNYLHLLERFLPEDG